MSYYLGVDPDLHTPAFALVDDAGRVVGVSVLKIKGSKGREAAVDLALGLCQEPRPFDIKDLKGAAIEGQQIYVGDAKNPDSLLLLAAAAGSLILATWSWYPGILADMTFPKPSEWKGGRPKQIHQKHILRRLGWEFGTVGAPRGKSSYAYPLDPPVGKDLNKTDWKHCVDAIGLALYAREVFGGR